MEDAIEHWMTSRRCGRIENDTGNGALPACELASRTAQSPSAGFARFVRVAFLLLLAALHSGRALPNPARGSSW